METRTKTPRGRWNAWQAGLFSISLAAASLLGCATASTAGSGGKTHIDDSRLAGLSADERAPVTQQEQALAKSRRDLDDAKEAKQEASNRLRLARTEHDIAEAQLSQAKTEADLSKKNLDTLVHTGTNAQLTQSMASPEEVQAHEKKLALANRDVDQADLRLKAVDAKIDYLKSLEDVASRTVNYDEKSVALERAKLEQAKYQTLQQQNPAETRAMHLQQADYDELIAKHNAEVANANSDLAKARADASSKYQVWVSADEKSGHRPITPSQAASVPPPPKG